MTAPFFSVVVPVFNGERYIEAAVSSVLDQTFGDFELIVSDDGSTDSTLLLLTRFCDPRLRVIEHVGEKNGPGGNRNFAIKNSRSDWIAFLDADDLWPSDHLAICAEAIHTFPDAVMFFGDYKRFKDFIEDATPSLFSEKGFLKAGSPYIDEPATLSSGVQAYRMHSQPLQKFCCIRICPISTPAVTLRREAMLAAGILFPQNWLINEDFHVRMEMLEAGPAVAINAILFYYRSNPDSLTSKPIRYLEGMAESHGEWMRRIWTTLDENERCDYRDKVAGFLSAAAWDHSRRGNVFAAVSAHFRSRKVASTKPALLSIFRTFARAMFWRIRLLVMAKAS